MKTSTIENLKFVRTWDWPNWTVYYYDMVMDNGDRWAIGRKEEGSLSIWEELTYELEEDKMWNPKFKLVNPKFAGKPLIQKKVEVVEKRVSEWNGSLPSFAISYSKDLVVGKAIPIEDMFEKADMILHRLKENA